MLRSRSKTNTARPCLSRWTPARFVLLYLCLLPLQIICQPFAGTYSLRPAGDGDFPTLQSAINAAAPGDTLLLAPGTYTGADNHNLNLLGKPITIISSDINPESCVIDCTQQARAFNFTGGEGNDTIIAGLTVTGGMMENGGAVRCSSAAPTFIRCHLFNNNAIFNGGALEIIAGSAPDFQKCHFAANAVNIGSGGGLWVLDSAPLFSDCRFLENTVIRGPGGGIWFGNSSLHFTDCTFSGNTIFTGSGGAVACASSEAQFTRCIFSRNVCTLAGGALELTSSNPIFTNCTFNLNSAGKGGALSSKNSKPILTNCTFAGNIAPQGSAIYSSRFSDVLLIRSIIADGSAPPCYCEPDNCFISLSSCCLFANQGGDWTGCIAHLISLSGNISADPLFCDPDNYNWLLKPDSPCLPANQPQSTGRILGAWPQNRKTGR